MSEEAHDRRAFFRELVRRTLQPAADWLDEAAEHLPKPHALLRPPGALPEAIFVETCRRCGACAQACPAQAIVPLEGPDERLKGTPAILPSRRACVVCDDLSCMSACPSGALVRLSVDDIRIGLAAVDAAACVRTRGEDCRACVDGCPIGSRAISLDGGGAVTIGLACVGCGVCEMVCPTRPRAVVVRSLAGA